MKKINHFFPHFLLALYIPFWICLAFDPYDRGVWWAENIPVLLVVLGLVLTYTRFRFSNLAYFLMAFWIFWHTVGGHFTFERVPFDWTTDTFGFERNHFDRFGHFFIGFFAFPIAEFLHREKFIQNKIVLWLFALFAIMSLAATYELIEWWFVVTFGGDAGASFLGSQGDIWDAQKDILMDTLGAIGSLLLFAIGSRKK